MTLAVLMQAIYVLLASLGVVLILLATMYDFIQISRRQQHLRIVRKLTRKQQPQVTLCITIETFDKERTMPALKECLTNIKKLHYTQYDIVVLLGKDLAAAEKKHLRKLRSAGTKISYYAPRAYQNHSEFIQTVLRRKSKSKYYVTLTPDVRLKPQSIKQAVALLALNPDKDVVPFLPEPRPAYSLINQLLAYISTGKQLARKALLATGSLPSSAPKTSVEAHEVVLYQKYALGSAGHNKSSFDLGLTYQSTAKVTPVYTQIDYLVLSFLTVIVGYAVYMQLSAKTALPLISSWAIVTTWILASVGFDDRLSLQQKVEYAAASPLGYFALPALLISSFVAATYRFLAIRS